MNTETQKISRQFKERLKDLYGDRFDNLVLFGSYARGDFNNDSDVDYLVILNDSTVKGSSEIAFVRKVVSDLSLEYSKLISILPVSKNRFNESTLPFYQIVRQEGIKI